MTLEIRVGDCRKLLREMPDDSVHCVVTSPPYYGLRDYGTGTWEGGDPACDHKQEAPRFNGPKQTTAQVSGHASAAERNGRKRCACGAVRIDQQIGLEPTLAEFIATMVEVFEEVRRVLRPDGTLWLNLGDSYNAYNGNRGPAAGANKNHHDIMPAVRGGFGLTEKTFKPKDMMGVPWRVAFALQEAGWYLRSDIPWVKRSAMPESVTDRPAKALEYVFLLTRGPRYFFDMEAVRRAGVCSHSASTFRGGCYVGGNIDNGTTGKRNGVPETPNNGVRNFRNADLWFQSVAEPRGLSGIDDELIGLDVTAEGFAEAHFATFPCRLVEPLIKAGTSAKGCCMDCGKPWVRVVERTAMQVDRSERTHELGRTRASGTMTAPPTSKTTGWQQACTCFTGSPVPCTVLDPFAGAGTTLLVARRLGCRAIGLELNEDYAEMARRRIKEDAPLFNTNAELFA